MESNNKVTRALVLGGGGVTGIAWELGIVTALYEAGIDLRQADLIVGTSAGSVVGAQISSGAPLDTLFASQLLAPGQTKERAVEFDLAKFQKKLFEIFQEAGQNPQAIRAGIGKWALETPTVPEEERRQIIASRLPSQEWPAQRLVITAVEAETGEPVTFERNSEVALVDAVAASCAVPGVWPPMTVKGRRYVDGGVRSTNNADLATGYDRILILSPIPPDQPSLGSSLKEEIAALEAQGSRVMVISPDQTALQAIGPNVLDPAHRAGSARAGKEQGQTLVTALRAFW
jgi:NTE family protein